MDRGVTPTRLQLVSEAQGKTSTSCPLACRLSGLSSGYPHSGPSHVWVRFC